MQVRKQEQYVNFMKLQEQLIKAQSRSRDRKNHAQSSAFSAASKFSKQSKKSETKIVIYNLEKQSIKREKGRQQTMNQPPTLNLAQGPQAKMGNITSELNQNFKSIRADQEQQKRILSQDVYKTPKITSGGYHGTRKVRSRNRNLAMDHQSLPQQQQPSGVDFNVINQVMQLQAKMNAHQHSHDNLKIEDQDQLGHANQISKRQARSRNAAIRQSLSQNTAPVAPTAPDAITDGSQATRPQGPIGMQNQYQQMLLGDQSLAQLTQLTLNSMGPSVQDDQSIQRLNEHLQDLSSNTNSNSKIGPENLDNFSASQPKIPKKLMPQNFFGVGATPATYKGALAAPYDNQMSQLDLRNLNMVMNLNKGRNTRIHGTHQQTTQVPMKNIGGTDNPSSVNDTSNINSSSVLTIGLPSVMSQGGGAAMLHVRNTGQQSNINLNMNMNFNIQHPLQIEDQSELQPAEAQQLMTRIQKSGRLQQHSSQHKRHLQRNQNKAMKQSDSIPKSDHLGTLSIHDNSKIQQLLSVQRSNQNSLKSLQKVAPVQKKPEQIKNIYNNLQNLSFNDQTRMSGQFVHHHKSLTKATNLSNYQSQVANQRRLIPLKKNANQSMAIPKNYLTAEQSESQQQMLLSKKNFRLQNAQNRQSKNVNNARSKTIPVKLSHHEAMKQPDLPVNSSHANSAENLRQTVAKAPQFQEPQNEANITIENQQLQEQSSELNISSNDPTTAQQRIQRQVTQEERGRQLSHISTALQYFRRSQKTNQAKQKILSMPSQQLSQILLKKIPIQQQKELLEDKQKSGQLAKDHERKQGQQHTQKNFQTDLSNSFQSSSKLSHQNESGTSKRKELQLLRQGSQRSLVSSQNASGLIQNPSNISNGECGSDQSLPRGAIDGAPNQKKIEKQFESANPYDLRIQENKQRNNSNDGLNKSKNNKFQSKKLIQMIQDQRAVPGQAVQKNNDGDRNEKNNDKNSKQLNNEFTFTNQNQSNVQIEVAQTEVFQQKYQKTKNGELEQSIQVKHGSKYPSSLPLASPEPQPVSGTGSQQILKMQEQSSAVKVRRGRNITNTVAPGIINFGFDSNSFEDESSSHYPERLDAQESQQFDTQLDMQYKEMQSNKRFDCENTELDLEPVRLGCHQQMNFEKKAAETQQVVKPYQYNLPSERSQNMFEQKSIRNDFEASQGFTSSDQGAPDGIDQDNDLRSPRIANANNREVLTAGINHYDERDQMQTAIVLQSGSASSREYSSQMQAEDTDRSCYIRRQTPAFKEKRRQKQEQQDNRRQGLDSRDENSAAEREELHTVLVRQTLPSRWSQQEAQSRRSRQSKEMPEDESTQNFARQFGITQTLERKSRRLSDNSDEFTNSLPQEQYQRTQNKVEIPNSYNEEHLQQSLNTNQKQKISRNSRFKNQSKTIAASTLEPRPQNEHKSLEQRLREEELLDGNELITIYRNGRGRPAGPRNRSRGDGRNPLLDSNQTIVSKQRVRQVPVSNAPKRLRNISTAKKNCRSSRHSESDKGEKSEKNLSMKQDSTKKNVYHIFGRQTSDSFVSVKQKSFDGRPEPATSAQATTGGGATLKEGQEIGQAISDSQKKQRKLLFALSQKQQSSLNHNFDENCRSDMRAKQRLHMQQSVQSFGKQQKRIPVTSLIERPRVSDYSGNQQMEGAEEQYRTVDALPRRRLYQQQHMDKPQRFFQCLEEYGSNPGGDRPKLWPPSDQVNHGDSQASGIDSEEECYGENWYSVGQPGPLQEYQEPKGQNQKQNRQRSAQSLQDKKHSTNQNLKARGYKTSKNYQAVLEMREINQGVVYDKHGRGRRTLGDGGPDGERLIFYNQSRTLTPRKEQEDPYHEGHHGVRIHHQLQFSTRQQDQHYSSLTREMPEHLSRGSAHQTTNNREGQSLRKSQNTEGDPPRRIKKPKDIYALHLQKPAEFVEDSEDQLQLISYNPPEQQRHDHTTSQGLERYNFVNYEGYDELEPESYIEVHQKSSTHQNEDPSYHRVFNFITIPYQSRNTHLVPGGQHTSSLVRQNESLFEISNQGGANGHQPPTNARNWRQHTSENRAIMHNRLQAKSKESFTRNRLNREANASSEMLCQDNMVILGSPKPNAGRGLPQKGVGGSDQVSGMRKLQRGRLRQAVGGGAKLRRVAMSQDPAIGSKSNYSLEANIDEGGKKGNAQNLAAWCCLHSKSRAASCESGTALKADHSDNASSGCSVF